MGMAETIEKKLNDALNPVQLVVEDESEQHRGHAGYREGGETHFKVRVVSESFDGVSRVNRQRMVYDLLKDELATRVHALQIQALTPQENAR